MNSSDVHVAFFDTKPYDREFFNETNQQGKFQFSLDFYETRLTPRSARIAEGSEAVCAFVHDDLGRETIQTLAKMGVKLIAMRCAGLNNVAVETVHELGLELTNVPEYSPYAVAEYTLGLLLTLNRQIHHAYNRVRENNFSLNGLLGFDLHDKTFGIIGTGRIGRRFAHLLQGFGAHILAHDPFPHFEAARALHLKYVPLDTLFAESDVISLHCPLTPENRYLLNSQTFARMKDGVTILNTSRGALIQTTDLIDALKSGKVSRAGLDVYEEETEYFFEDCSGRAIADDNLARLMTFPNVIVTSHQAFFTREALQNIAESTLESIRTHVLFKNQSSFITPHFSRAVKNPGAARESAERFAVEL